MCDAHLTVKEVTPPPLVPDHYSVPVVVTVESKLCATGPLMMHHPKHCVLVILVERIVRVN